VPDDGSVWDTGPQYPEIWPGPSGEPEPVDMTPESLSPVDIDAPTVPVAPVPTPEARGEPQPPWWSKPLLGLATWVWLLVLAAIVTLLVLVFVTDGADDPELTSVTSTVVPTPAPETAPVTVPVATSAVAITTAPQVPPPTAAATAAPTAPPTAPPATAPPATAPPVTAAPTAAPTTPPVATTIPPATLPPDGPVVTIIGSVGPCSFGSECLIAGFTIHNFDTQPNEFVCEFADGSRYTFRFDSQGVERACATGDPSGSITIEVAGVRSETFTRP
jgi:hypothetical protein